MLNLIIIILLINYIIGFIFKPNNSILMCGIFAWVGITPDKFSPFMFNVLGAYNDNRGGDSAGVYFNKNCITGIKTEAKYEALVKTKKLHTTLKLTKYPVAIGHCRKASVGSVIEPNIQPVLIRAKENRLIYVQAHNGTIYNHKELAKKYSIEYDKDESDSNVLAKIIAKEGFKVLSEYEGSAALVMYFPKEPNVLYAFHGESKNYNYLAEERPLHYVTYEGYGTYISSEAGPLEFIANGHSAYPFKPNVVYKLYEDKVEEFLKIERTNASQRKVENTSSTYAYQSRNDSTIPWKVPTNVNADKKSLPDFRKDLIQVGVTKNICTSLVTGNIFPLTSTSKLRYDRGCYWIGNEMAHGKYIVDTYGYIRNNVSYKQSIQLFCLYFCYGNLMVNESSYKTLISICSNKKIQSAEKFYNKDAFNSISDHLSSCVVHPFTRRNNTSNLGYVEPTEIIANTVGDDSSFYSGSFAPLFSDVMLFFEMGDFQGYKRLDSVCTVEDIVNDYPFLLDAEFGDLSESDADELLDSNSPKDCITCTKTANFCSTCDVWSKPTKTEKEKEEKQEEDLDTDDIKVSLLHSIVTSADEIQKNTENLISEIHTSGYADLVKEKITILEETITKLKEISK